MTVGVAVFVKTPGHSALKTRLAAGLGTTLAAAFHLRGAAAVAEVIETAAQRRALRGYWAVAEEDAIAANAWVGFPPLAQGEGGLGARMARVHEALIERHGAALLVGADAPQIDPDALVRAAEWLESDAPRLALGPARDGGFWLFGSNKTIEQTRWDSVEYGREDTAARFREALEGSGEWLRLGRLSDLDRAEDVPIVAAELAALANPLPRQRALAGWLAGLRR